MTSHKFILLFILGFVLCITIRTHGESSTCLTLYKEGGAPAVFQSPKCPRWNLPKHDHRRQSSPAGRCQSATRLGRRNSQEDRTFCTLDIRIPFPGPNGITEINVGIVAVFDGHNGAEASEMASKLLLEYFTLHTYFLLDTTFSILSKKSNGMLPHNGENDHVAQMLSWDENLGQHVLNIGRFKLTLSAILDGSSHLEILKESLLRAINDIDAAFSKEAYRNSFNSGSTATVILIADGQILVANIGDSKAFLCSEVFQFPPEAKATLLRLYRKRRLDGAMSRMKDYGNFKLAASDGLLHFSAKELTRDHHPDRDDERSRVESAGGHVLEWAGISRVNGQLAVSRAIGDVSFKSFGVISVPEVTDWQFLTANDSYLVAASDGVLEKLSPQDVCDLLWEVRTVHPLGSELSPSCSFSLADCIVDTALEKGSTDNMAAVVIPFGSETLVFERSDDRELQEYISEPPDLEHTRALIAKFSRLLVGGKQSSFGCFYLSESLSENDDYTFWLEKDEQDSVYDSPKALPDAFHHSYGGPLNLYSDQTMCLHFGISTGGDRDQCINHDGFASFLGFLESLPAHNVEPNQESYERMSPNTRYILKKRFDRGSYGEVWVAFHWNCSHRSNSSNWSTMNRTFPFDNFGTDYGTSQTSEAPNDFSSDPPNANMFILKRIMVERGNTIYLSGLREKYFGELFRNASAYMGATPSVGYSDSRSTESHSDMHNRLRRNESVAEIKDSWKSESISSKRKRQPWGAYEEGLKHIARFVESFESKSNEIWLVFCHEGISLSKLLYTADDIENSAGEENGEIKRVRILHPSKWWHWLKTTEEGREQMRNLIWQLLIALKSCHDRNITHRDIKPGKRIATKGFQKIGPVDMLLTGNNFAWTRLPLRNMVICFEDQESGRCLKGSPSIDQNYTTKMRVIDFGSAMDDFTIKHLYGAVGPSRDEQTNEYMPPEAFLNATWYQGPTSITTKYDMWGVGVVILELIIGSPDIFQINAMTRALLDRHLKGWNEGLKNLAYKLRSFMEMCILLPGSTSKHHRAWDNTAKTSGSPASWKCSEEYFSSQIKNRDPLRIGFPDVWALRLVRQLLVWDPEDRLSVDEALRHPYFSRDSKQ